MNFNIKKSAFTLSEVMLTLSLIGFLATMTLSTVGSSVQQRARLSEFRAAYSKMAATLKNITLDTGKIYNCYECPTDDEKTLNGLSVPSCTAKNLAGDDNEEKTLNGDSCNSLMGTFVRSLGATHFCENNPKGEGCLPDNYPSPGDAECFQNLNSGHAYVLDNSMIIFDDAGSSMTLFAVDINGRKGPNKWGQDIFTFSTKVTESVEKNGKTFVKEIGILPPTSCLPGKAVGYDPNARQAHTPSSMSTDQMLKASANFKHR